MLDKYATQCSVVLSLFSFFFFLTRALAMSTIRFCDVTTLFNFVMSQRHQTMLWNTMLYCTHWFGRNWTIQSIMSTTKLCVVTALLGIFMETTNIKMSLDLGSLYVNINDVVIIFYIMIQNITKSLIVICTFLAVRLRSNCGHAVRCGQLPYDRMRCGAVAVTFLGLRCGAVAVTFWHLRCGAVAVKHQALRCGRGHMFRWPRRALTCIHIF